MASTNSIIYSPNQKTAIRAGYGIFYVTGASYISTMLQASTGSGNGGLLNVYTVDNATLGVPTDTPVMTLSSIMPPTEYASVGSFPVSVGTGKGYFGDSALSTIYYLDQKSTALPYYQRMMFDIQQLLGPHDTLDIGYAGTQGRKDLNQLDLNWPTPSMYRTRQVFPSPPCTESAEEPLNRGQIRQEVSP
jgi:hypothetical protein